MNKYIVDALNTGVVDIEFTKKNGSTRFMKGTRCFDLIPNEHYPMVDPIKEQNATEVDADLVKVFDLDINEWRAFRLSRLVSWCPETIPPGM